MSDVRCAREDIELHIARLREAYRIGDVPDETINPALEGLAFDPSAREEYFHALVDLVEAAVAEDLVRGRRTCGTAKMKLGKPLREVAHHQAIAFLGSVLSFHESEEVRSAWYETEPNLERSMSYF